MRLALLGLLCAGSVSAAPYLEVTAGPAMVRRSSGPLLRLDLGAVLGDRLEAGLWASGAMLSAPLATPGDHALLSAGASLQVLALRLDDRLGLWARGGLGWSMPAAGDGVAGPGGFAGAALLFRPAVQRFAVGIEADALASRAGLGWALLPSLRCSL